MAMTFEAIVFDGVYAFSPPMLLDLYVHGIWNGIIKLECCEFQVQALVVRHRDYF